MRHIIPVFALFALTACDVQDELLTDAGTPTPDEAPVEVAPPAYTWVLVEDTSIEMNAFGAPGADICGVAFDCGGGVRGVGVDAHLWAGDGEACRAGGEVNGEACFADRDDPLAAVGSPHDPCEADSSPSHYVALGLGGVLAVRVDTDDGDLPTLEGCSVTIYERTRRDAESFQVSVCADAGGVQCLQPAPLAVSPDGGDVRFVVPMP